MWPVPEQKSAEVGPGRGAGHELGGRGLWDGSLGTESRKWGSLAGRRVTHLFLLLFVAVVCLLCV